MPSSTFTHTIAVMGLMAVFFLLLTFLTGVQRASLNSQAEPLLEDVVNYVAGYLVDIILVPNSTQPVTLIKQIEIPYDVAGQGYTVRLQLVSDVWKVTACLDTMPWVYAEAALPWNASGSIDVVVADDGPIEHPDIGTWWKRSLLYSGTRSPIVWSNRTESGWELGLGSLSQLAASSTLTESTSQTFMHIHVAKQPKDRSIAGTTKTVESNLA